MFDGLLTNDFLGKTANDNESLITALRHAGITPIPMAVLDQHKRDEIARHPASRLWKYRDNIDSVMGTMFFGTLVASVGAIISWIAVLTDSPSSIAVGFACMATVVMIAGFVGFIALGMLERVVGPAKWVEKRTWTLPNDVPTTIHNIATRLQTTMRAQHPCSVQFVVGTLYQESRLLDPYLLVTNDKETACLGIWDEDRIIQIAHVE